VLLVILFPLASGLVSAKLPAGLLVVQAFGLLAVWLWARSTGWSIWPLLRADLPATPRSLALGLGATLVGLLGGGGVTALAEAALPPSLLEQFDQARYFSGSGWKLWSMVVGAIAGAPLFEELAFRGGLLSAFALRRGARSAIVLSALVFAAFHLDPVHLAGTFFLGLLYGWLALRTGSIWPSMLAHALNNGVAVLALAGAPDPDSARLTAPQAAALLALALGGWWLLEAAARRWLPPSPPIGAVLVPRAGAVPRTPTTAAAAPSPSGSAPPGTEG
jgi:membrane protease YdiL (CAAX protease family)